jgi:hypothetical protein
MTTEKFEKINIHMNNPPTILDQLDEIQKERYRFVQPKAGEDLWLFDTPENPKTFPSTILRIARVSLKADTAVPFHRHARKEKIYLHMGNANVFVVVLTPEHGIKKFLMESANDRVVIPPGHWHALVCLGVLRGETCNIMVVSSSQEADDIEWEPDKDRLLENKHIFVGPPGSD